jgi:hypothetical protein
MSRNRKPSRGKKIKPHFWVFCEGQTEEAYVCYLRSKYRIPIEIIPKVIGSNIDERKIKNHKKGKPTHEKDMDFLLYDADVPTILERLQMIDNVTLLISNPTIELWFLLHYKNQVSNISSAACIKEISQRNRNKYKKGIIDNRLEIKLIDKCKDACKRAKNLKIPNNPSSNIYKLIEILENTKKQ